MPFEDLPNVRSVAGKGCGDCITNYISVRIGVNIPVELKTTRGLPWAVAINGYGGEI